MKKPAIEVAIVGRINVGKSTLFNRLLGRRLAIVDKTPRVTRDPVRGEVEHEGTTLVLWDTGGFIPKPGNDIEKAVNVKIQERIKNCDVVLFVVDGRAGVTPSDEEIAALLRPLSEKVTVAVNKIDSADMEYLTAEFHSLGFEKVLAVSAQSGLGIYELLNTLLSTGQKHLRSIHREEEADKGVFVAIAGRPNVGKSTLLNALTGQERAIVTDIPGTTRDPIIETVRKGKITLTLVDTAGVRRPSKVRYGIEFFSAGRSLEVIERADAVIVVADAAEGLVAQDIRLLSLALRKGRAAVLALNKWDLVESSKRAKVHLDKTLSLRMKPFAFVPVVPISAKDRFGLNKLISALQKAVSSWSMRVPTAQVNRVLQEILENSPPVARGKKPVKVRYMTQVSTRPPHFVLFANAEDIPGSYIRFLKNRLREHFHFTGTEILVDVRLSR